MATNLRHSTSLSRTDRQRSTMLEQVNGLAWLLDNSIKIPIINYRIGLDAVIGLIPGLGDVAGSAISSLIVLQAIRLGAPRATLTRMVLNILIEAVIGLVPMVGDIFDATFKANARNVALLRAAVDPAQTGRPIARGAGRGTIVVVIAVLVGIILLIGAAGAAIFWAILSLFQ